MIFLLIAGYVVNEFYLKEIFWRKNFFKIVYSLQDNFDRNYQDFPTILDFGKKVKPIDMIYFYENDIVKINTTHVGNDKSEFFIYFSNSNKNKISYSGEPTTEIEESFLKENQNFNFQTLLDTSWTEINWTYDYKGNRKEKDFENILKYFQWTSGQLDTLQRHLEDINCLSFEKQNDGIITMTYWGGWIESFDYIIVESDKVDIGILNHYDQLGVIETFDKQNIYWAYFKHRLISIESFVN